MSFEPLRSNAFKAEFTVFPTRKKHGCHVIMPTLTISEIRLVDKTCQQVLFRVWAAGVETWRNDVQNSIFG